MSPTTQRPTQRRYVIDAFGIGEAGERYDTIQDIPAQDLWDCLIDYAHEYVTDAELEHADTGQGSAEVDWAERAWQRLDGAPDPATDWSAHL